ncbi:hypothetical protein RI367_008093 [Sorochytrium milnesiophthora]
MLGAIKAWYTPLRGPKRPLLMPLGPNDMPSGSGGGDRRNSTGSSHSHAASHDSMLPSDKRDNSKRRYCNARFTRAQFIALHLLLGGFLFMVIVVPLMYFVVVPHIIRSKVANMPLSSMNVTRMDIKGFQADGLSFSFATSMPEQFPISISSKIRPISFELQSAAAPDSTSTLVALDVPELEVNLKHPDVAFDGAMRVDNPDNAQALIKQLSSDAGMPEQTLHARMVVDISVFGIKFYPKFALEKALALPAIKGDLLSFWNSLPDYIKTADERTRVQAAQDKKSLTVSNTDGQFTTFSFLPDFPPVLLSSLDISSNDKGPTLTLGMRMDNPTVITVTLPSAAFYFSVEEQNIARVTVNGFTLQKGQSDMKLVVGMEFLNDARNKTSVAIYRLMSKLLGGNVIKMDLPGLEPFDANAEPEASVTGPITLDQADFVAKATPPLQLRMPIKEVLNQMGLPGIKDLLTAPGIQLLLRRASFNATVSSTDITLPMSITVPPILPLPPQPMHVPFVFSVTTGINNVDTLSLRIENLEAVHSPQGIVVSTIATITPVNTEQARDAITSLTDTVLWNLQPSQLTIKNMSLVQPDTKQPVPWSSSLLDGLEMPIPIPAINLAPIANAFTDNGAHIPVALKSLALHQLDAQPGFDATATMDLLFPGTDAQTQVSPDAPFQIPQLTVDLGYAHAEIDIDDVQLMQASMNSGLHLNQGHVTDLGVEAILARNDQIGGKVQSTVSQFLQDVNLGGVSVGGGSNQAERIVVRGLTFGQSQAKPFITFSGVRIPLRIADMRPMVSNMVKSVLGDLRQNQQALAKVLSADLQVASATQLRVGANVQLSNPFNLDVSIGSTSMAAGLNDASLASITIAPLVIKPGQNTFALSTTVDLIGSGESAQRNVKAVVEALWQYAVSGSDVSAALGNMQLSAGKFDVQSPASNKAGEIDQFSNMAVSIPVAPVISSVMSAKLVDISALLPKSLPDLINNLPITVNALDLTTQAQATLTLGVSVTYTNPLPLTLSLPYAAFDFSLGNAPLASISVSNITLAKQGTLSPIIVMRFTNNADASNALAAAVDSVTKTGRINVPAAISGILFGTSSTQTNSLLSTTNLGLPLPLVDFKPIISSVVTRMLGAIPSLNSLDDIERTFNPTIASVAVKTLPGKSLAIALDAQINNPLPISATIGFTSFSVAIDGVGMVNLAVAPLNLGLGRAHLQTSLTMSVIPSAEASSKFNAFVSRFLSGDELDFSIGVSNLLIGVSSTDVVRAMQPVQLAVPLQSIIKGQRPRIDLEGILAQKIGQIINPAALSASNGVINVPIFAGIAVELSNTAVSVLAGKRVGIDVTAKLTTPFSADFNIGYFAASALLNDHQLATVSGNVALTSGKDAPLHFVLQVNDAQDIRDEVGKVAQAVASTGAFNGAIAMTNAVLGTSADDVIDIVSQFKLSLPLSAVAQPVFDYAKSLMSNLFGSNNGTSLISIGDASVTLTLSPSLSIVAQKIEVSTAPAHSLAIKLSADVNTPIPISINVPYIAAAIGVDDAQLVGLSLQNMALNSGRAQGLAMSMVLAFENSDAAAQKIGQLVDAVMNSKPLAGVLAVSGAVVGVSPQDTINTFSAARIQLGLEQVAGPIVRDMRRLFSSMIDLNKLKVVSNGAQGWTVSLSDTTSLALQSVDAEVLPGKRVSAKVATQVRLPFRIGLDVGYFGTSVLINDQSAMAISVSQIHIDSSSDTHALPLTLSITFSDSDAVDSTIAALFDHIVNKQPLDGTLGIKDIAFGVSADDRITALQQVKLGLPLQQVAAPFLALIPANIDPFSLIDQLGLKTHDIAVNSAPGARLDISLGAAFKNPLPVAIKVGYASLQFGIDRLGLVSVRVGSLQLAGGDNALGLQVSLQFINGDQQQAKVADLVNAVMAGTPLQQQLSVSSVQFGASDQPQDVIEIASKVTVNLPAATVVNSKGLDFILAQIGLSRADLSLDWLLGHVDVQQADLDLQQAGVINLNAKVAIAVNLNAKINIGYAGLTALLDGTGLATVDVGGIQLQTVDGQIVTSTKVSVVLASGDDIENKVAGFVQTLMDGKNTTSSVGVTGVSFGNAKDDVVSIARSVSVSVPAQVFIDKAMPFVNDLMHRFMDLINILDVTVGIYDPTTMTATAQVDLSKLPLIGRLSTSIGFVSLDVGLNNVPAMTPRLSNLVIANGKLTVATMLSFSSLPESFAQFAALGKTLGAVIFKLPTDNAPITASVANLRFGASPTNLFTIAEKVKVSLALNKFLDMAVQWYNAHSPFNFDDIQATLTPEGIDARVTIANQLPIPITANIPSITGNLFFTGFNDAFVQAYVTELVCKPGQPLSFHIVIDTIQPVVNQVMAIAVPRLVEFVSYSQDTFIGGIRLHTVAEPRTAKPGETFIPFRDVRIAAPPLLMWGPLTIRPHLINPFTQGLGIDVDVGFPNPGPIHINVGNVRLALTDTRRNEEIGHLEIDNVVFLNNRELKGGSNVEKAKARFTLNLLAIPGVLVDLIGHPEAFQMQTDIRWEADKALTWINDIINSLPKPLIANFWKVLMGILHNSSIRLFGNDQAKAAVAAVGNSTVPTLPASTNSTSAPAVTTNTTASAAVLPPANHTLSRRWLSRRAEQAINEAAAKQEITKWQKTDLFTGLDEFVQIDWSALTVSNE